MHAAIPFGIGEESGNSNCAGAFIHLAVGKEEGPVLRINQTIRKNRLEPQTLVRRYAALFSGEALSPREILRLANGEIHLDKVDCRNRNHCSAGGVDESTYLKFRATDIALPLIF